MKQDEQPLVTPQDKLDLSRGAREIRGRVKDIVKGTSIWRQPGTIKEVSPSEQLLSVARWASDNPEKGSE